MLCPVCRGELQYLNTLQMGAFEEGGYREHEMLDVGFCPVCSKRRYRNRANATFYTIDPRGLVAGPDIDQQLETQEWQTYVRETQDSLRVLAEQTGGIAVVNQNDFDKALKRIDAETSDYYVLGYYSSNPDPLRRTRRIEVKTKRDGVTVWSRTSYSLRPLPAAN